MEDKREGSLLDDIDYMEWSEGLNEYDHWLSEEESKSRDPLPEDLCNKKCKECVCHNKKE